MNQRGSVMAGVIVIGLLISCCALGAYTAARLSRRSAQARWINAQAELTVMSALEMSATWFDAQERGSLIPPPRLDQLERHTRRADPANLRYRESGGAPLRPPLLSADGQFLGTPEQPDACVSDSDWLHQLSLALDPSSRSRVTSICWFAPPPASNGQTLASIDAVVTTALPSATELVLRARAELVALADARSDRPVIVLEDATWLGDARWEQGEGVIGGTLHAAAMADAGSPGGIPWGTVDRPIEDLDEPQLSVWRALPGVVPDPWWRARIGGEWIEAPPTSGRCAQPWPFGPRRTPPEDPSKEHDHSGAFVRCSSSQPLESIPGAWEALRGARVRGVIAVVEDPSDSSCFRIDDAGSCRALESLTPANGALTWIQTAATRTTPLRLQLHGGRGVIAIRGADLELEAARFQRSDAGAPGDPRNPRGEERPSRSTDFVSRLSRADSSCDRWQVEAWGDPQVGPLPSLRWSCAESDWSWLGAIATDQLLMVGGGVRIAGQLRAQRLRVDGETLPVRVIALDGLAESAEGWPGFPGVPRVLAVDRRLLH
jgi:hypothetical protein